MLCRGEAGVVGAVREPPLQLFMITNFIYRISCRLARSLIGRWLVVD